MNSHIIGFGWVIAKVGILDTFLEPQIRCVNSTSIDTTCIISTVYPMNCLGKTILTSGQT